MPALQISTPITTSRPTVPVAKHAAAADDLWAEYRDTTDQHPNIPNVSFAGYAYGERPLPAARTPTADVRQCGAQGDGILDDTAAFEKAILQAHGGDVAIPPGTYRLTRRLLLQESGTVLRGAGSASTTLHFDRSLSDLYGAHIHDRESKWAWSGGLLCIEPTMRAVPPPEFPVVGPADAGSHAVTVSPATAARLSTMVGKPIAMRWSGGMDLVAEIFGHASGRTVEWNRWVGLRQERLVWDWTNDIVSVTGQTVVLKKPLRLRITDARQVVFRPQAELQRIGVVGMRIEMPEHREQSHLRELGFNAIAIHQAHHCWVADVVIHNADNGIILEGSTNTTLSHMTLTGMPMHHAFSFRSGAHDNLVEDFMVRTKVRHGLSAQDLASGNVWHRGVMHHGTFDSHRGMPFDSVRTAIKIASDGIPGGSRNAGPFAGRRIVHWNIELLPNTSSAGLSWIANPQQYASGAIVGIYGTSTVAQMTTAVVPAAMPPGDKGTRTSRLGRTAEPDDLYEAQVKLRLETEAQAQDHLAPPVTAGNPDRP